MDERFSSSDIKNGDIIHYSSFGPSFPVTILEQARSNVVRAVNNNMVIAYWLIGREVVQQIQGGDERAEYGKQVIEQLSAELNNKYARGFSTTNLRYFRTFYTAYSDRIPEIRHTGGGEFKVTGNRHTQSGVLAAVDMAIKQIGVNRGFSPNFGWSHYRDLMNVEHQNERFFYEIDAEGWGKSVVECLSADLRNEFPQITGFSSRNIWRMRSLFLAWTEGIQKLTQAVAEFDGEKLPQPVAEIPWGHNILLLEKLKSPSTIMLR